MAKTLNLDDFLPNWLKDDPDLAKLDANQRKQFLAQYESAIRELLEKFDSSRLNQTAGGTRGRLSVRIPGTNSFFNLTSGLWTLAKYGGPVVLAATVAAPLLAAIGISVAGTVTLSTAGSAVAALYNAFANLNSLEMDTYLAVVAAIDRHKMKILTNRGATLDQVMESFDREEDLMRPQDVNAVLKGLVDKKVLKHDPSTGVSEYFLAF